jgi:hypothetical protein
LVKANSMNINLTSENAAAVTNNAKILGCSESEFLNRYLERHLDDPEDGVMSVWDTIETLVQFAFKSREEAQRVLDWFYVEAKANAVQRGVKVRIRTEIIEMSPCYSNYLESAGLEEIYMIKVATYNVGKENEPIHVASNPDLEEEDAPEYRWSAEPGPKAEK